MRNNKNTVVKRIKQLLILLLTILVFIVIIELISMLILNHKNPAFSGELLRVSEDTILGYELAPNYITGERILEDNKVVYRDNVNYMSINSHGLRDIEYEYKKPNNTVRILVLGDSVTFGRHLRIQDVYTEVLERRLNNQSNISFEVINAGVEGYSSVQEARYLEIEGIKYDLDIIIVGFVLNDVTSIGNFIVRILGYEQYIKRDKAINDMVEMPLKCSILGSSYFLQLSNMRTYINNFLVEKKYPEYASSKFLSSFQNKCLMKRLHHSFDKIAYLSSEKDIPVITVIFPLLQDLRRYPYKELHDELENIMLEKGFFVVDMEEHYSKHNDLDLQLIGRDTMPGLIIHPNELGHRIVGQAIHEKLVEEGLV